MDDHKQKMKEAKAKMEKLNGQTDAKNHLTLPNCQTFPLDSEIGRPVTIEDREVPFRNIFRFRELKIHGVTSDGKDRISYTNLSKR